MKTLYLHIGTNKTGTTAIQAFLSRRRKALAEQGILVPEHGHSASGNYSLLARDLMRAQSSGNSPITWLRFLQEVANSDAKTVLVSGEMFYPLPKKPFWKMAEDLKRVFDDIRIVCYLRPQDEYLKANYTQGIKMGRVGQSFEAYKDHILSGRKLQNYRYAQTLKKWAKAFGAENLIIRPYEASQLARGDVVADFCKVCGLPKAMMPLKTTEQRANKSPGAKVVQAMLYAGSLMPPMEKYPQSVRHVALCVAISEKLCAEWQDTPFEGFGPGEARQFLNGFRKENQAIAREYLGRKSGHLFRPGSDAAGGVPLAVPVVVELTKDERAYVASLVKHGLEKIAEAEKAGVALADVLDMG